MRGFVDLHCHWIAGIDDGARSVEEGIEMLAGLHAAGFSLVVATPHMRPGMFDNDRAALRAAYDRMLPHIAAAREPMPRVELSSEHFFDDVVFERFRKLEAIPYPLLAPTSGAEPALEHAAAGAALVELPTDRFPNQLQRRFFDLNRFGVRPVLAHPERYQPVWADDGCLEPLLDAGARLLLDVCALVGKYGRRSQATAEKLLDDGAYEAACTDAHRAADVDVVKTAILRLEERVGEEEANRLLAAGPSAILARRSPRK